MTYRSSDERELTPLTRTAQKAFNSVRALFKIGCIENLHRSTGLKHSDKFVGMNCDETLSQLLEGGLLLLFFLKQRPSLIGRFQTAMFPCMMTGGAACAGGVVDHTADQPRWPWDSYLFISLSPLPSCISSGSARSE